mmetsp:Transcript_16138/g.61111  ORF Transcript_16138/g.61111 Transcript_16138/m.61111 type:complete len:235 (+) Transcript_16138:170-874(+)
MPAPRTPESDLAVGLPGVPAPRQRSLASAALSESLSDPTSVSLAPRADCCFSMMPSARSNARWRSTWALSSCISWSRTLARMASSLSSIEAFSLTSLLADAAMDGIAGTPFPTAATASSCMRLRSGSLSLEAATPACSAARCLSSSSFEMRPSSYALVSSASRRLDMPASSSDVWKGCSSIASSSSSDMPVASSSWNSRRILSRSLEVIDRNSLFAAFSAARSMIVICSLRWCA